MTFVPRKAIPLKFADGNRTSDATSLQDVPIEDPSHQLPTPYSVQPSRISCVEGSGIVIRGNDIDTDRIIPARYLKAVTFDELGGQVFFDERFDEKGQAKAHPFNDARFRGARILLVNRNFGCGSSREHAPQALMRWGIHAVVGESFGEIFASNCMALGIPAVTATTADIGTLMAFVEQNPSEKIDVDVGTDTLRFAGKTVATQMPESTKNALVSGSWDSLQSLLDAGDQIEATAAQLPYLAFNTWTARRPDSK